MKGLIAFTITWIVCALAFWGAIIWAVVHFVSKY